MRSRRGEGLAENVRYHTKPHRGFDGAKRRAKLDSGVSAVTFLTSGKFSGVVLYFRLALIHWERANR